jgi:hypothetical protein
MTNQTQASSQASGRQMNETFRVVIPKNLCMHRQFCERKHAYITTPLWHLSKLENAFMQISSISHSLTHSRMMMLNLNMITRFVN